MTKQSTKANKKIKKVHLGLFFFAAFIITLLLINMPGWLFSSDHSFRHIKETGKLRVLTRNTSTTYYELRDEPAGTEYELAKAFADHLNVELELIVKPNIPELLSALKRGEADLVAAGITRTEERENTYLFGPDYQTIQQQVVCGEKIRNIESVKDLVGKDIAVITGSSYEESLNEWKQDYPELIWKSIHYLSTEQLLETVALGKLDCTLSDSNILAVNRRYYPQLKIAFPASEAQQLAWVIPDNSQKLRQTLENWFQKIENSNHIASIMERYYGHIDVYDHVDLQVFKRRIKNRLPKYRKMIEATASKYGIPWTLLAAQAYQESHWDPKAKSPTGVRGFMMLTLSTAKSVGVKSRLDAKQNINGGARYLKKMIRRLPDEISGEDRMYFALAAYNIGMGHLQDARKLAPTVGKNPNIWLDLKEVLPLLSDKYHYEKLKHGYARGKEPVMYVTRIRNYEDVLKNTLKIDEIANKKLKKST